MNDNYILAYLVWVAIAFLLFAKKPKDFGAFSGKIMAWWCAPALLIIYITVAYFQKKKFRWLAKKWLLVGTCQLCFFLVYGMMEDNETHLVR